MTPIREAFRAMASTDPAPATWPNENTSPNSMAAQYAHFHSHLPGSEASLLTKFLDSNLDETRLFYAESFAQAILRLTDFDDASYFRYGVLRRELSGDMAYDRQRDHAAHTVNNYLLGWYLMCHSRTLADAMSAACEKRLRDPAKDYDYRSMYHTFGSIWMIPTLLHDIGYIFEGGLDAKDSKPAVKKAKKGAEYAQDFFNTQLWEQIRLGPKPLKDEVFRLTGVVTPQIAKESLGEISNSLRDLGDLTTLWNAVLQERPELRGRAGYLALERGLLGDAFLLWKANYDFFGASQMARYVDDLEAVHTGLMSKGIQSLGIRVLDHGITGGMLLLLHSTLFFRIYFGLKKGIKASSQHPEIRKGFSDFFGSSSVPYEASWWWGSLIWATGAIAFHNVVQTEEPWATCKLKLTDDPLAYLSILVDVLQEWDRYTSSRNSVFTGALPTSSNDIYVKHEDGRIMLFCERKVFEKVTEGLGCLDRWEDILLLRSLSN